MHTCTPVEYNFVAVVDEYASLMGTRQFGAEQSISFTILYRYNYLEFGLRKWDSNLWAGLGTPKIVITVKTLQDECQICTSYISVKRNWTNVVLLSISIKVYHTIDALF